MRRPLVFIASDGETLRAIQSDSSGCAPLVSKVVLSKRLPVIASNSITQPEPP